MDKTESKFGSIFRDLDKFEKRVQQMSTADPEILEILQGFSSTFEELHVASEEINHQNAELEAAHQILEYERLRYQSLFDGAPDGYLVTDDDGLIEEINQAAVALFGDKAHLVGKPMADLVEAQDYRRFTQMLQSLKGEAPEIEREITFNPDSKASFPALLKASPIVDAGGKAIGVRWLIRDYTIHKQTQKALQDSEYKFRSLFLSAPDPIFLYEMDENHNPGTIVEVNEKACQVLGYNREELLGKTRVEIESPEGRKLLNRRIKTFIRNRQDRFTNNAVLITKNEDILPVEVTSSLVEMHGKPVILSIARNVSERWQLDHARKGTQKQHLSNTYNRSLIEASMDPLVAISPQGKIGDANHAAEVVTGLSRSELIGTDFSDFFTDPERARVGYQRVFLNGEVRDYELQIRHRDGHVTPVLYNASLYRDDAGQVLGVFAAARDMTKHLQAEQQLRLQTAALESAANGIFITDNAGRIQWSNPAFTRMTGYSAAEILGKDPNFLKSGKVDRVVYEQLWKKVLSGQVWQGELVNRRKDGSLYSEEQTVAPVFGQNGEISHFIAIKQDITERKRAEGLAREQTARVQVMADVARTLSEAGTDDEVVIDQAGQRIAELTGTVCTLVLLADEGLPQGLTVTFFPVKEALPEVEKAALAHTVQEVMTHLNKTGEPAFIANLLETSQEPGRSHEYKDAKEVGYSSLLAAPLSLQRQLIGALILLRRSPADGFIMADQLLAQNLADRTALAVKNARLYADLERSLDMEQSLRNQIIQVEKFSAVGRMVASIAHEMNNPLQTVKNCLFLAKREVPTTDGHEYLDMATSEVQRISRLVAQLREVYRPRTAGMAEPVEIMQTLDEVAALIDAHLQREHVALERDGLEKHFVVNGIADQLKQVFLNICLNAIEAMEPEGGTLRISIETSPDKRQVGVTFRDSGQGIAEENLPKIFQPLFTTKEFGLGLGLSISNDIVQKHSGSIAVASTPGQGASFTVWLPLSDDSMHPAKA